MSRLSIQKLRLAICVSGGGSTMQQILKACQDSRLSRVDPALVISSKPRVPAIQRALDAGVPAENVQVVSRSSKTQEGLESEILSLLLSRHIDLVAMCGFLPIMPLDVVQSFKGKIFNQHPGPLDNPGGLGFGGQGMHGRAVHHAVLTFSNSVSRSFHTCCTVHHTTAKVDEGMMIAVHPVEVLPGDSAQTLADRVLPHEHQLVIGALYQFAESGQFGSYRRREPLIYPGEEDLFHQALEAGRKQFPNG